MTSRDRFETSRAVIIFWPAEVVVGEHYVFNQSINQSICFTAILLLLIFVSYPSTLELTGRKSINLTGHMFDMHVQNLWYPFRRKILAPKSPNSPKTTYLRCFSTTSQLNGNLTAYIFETKHDSIDNLASTLETTRGLLHHLKISLDVGPQLPQTA